MRSAYLTALLISASLAGAAPMSPDSPLDSLSDRTTPLLDPLSNQLSTSSVPPLSALTNARPDLRGPPGAHSASVLRKRQLALGSIPTEGLKSVTKDQKIVPLNGGIPSNPETSPETSAAIYQAYDELRTAQQIPPASAISSLGSKRLPSRRDILVNPLAEVIDNLLDDDWARVDKKLIAGSGPYRALGSDTLGRRVVKRGWNMYMEEQEVHGRQYAGADEMDDRDDEPFWG